MKKYIYVALISIFLCAPAYSAPYTLSQLRDELRRETRDTDSSNYRRTDVTFNDRLTFAESEFVKKSRCVHRTTYTTTSYNTAQYSLPSDWVTSDRVMYAIIPLTSSVTNYKQLDYTTKEGLDLKNGASWEDSSVSYPTKYFYSPTDKINLFPKPSTANAGVNFLKIDYTSRVSSMTADSDMPFDGFTSLYDYHYALVWFALSLCAIDDNDMTKADWFMKKFEYDVEVAKNEINNKPDKVGSGGITPK